MAKGRSARQNPFKRLTRAVVDLAAWKIALILAALGAALLYLSALSQEPTGPSAFETVLQEVGALLVVAGTLSVLWDLRGRRALSEEVLAAANVSADVTSAGLRGVSSRYLDVEWDAMINRSSQVDLFFAYARTWRNTHATALRQLVARDSVRLRVILPDRTDEPLMTALAAKFRYTPAQLDEHIADAESDFENLARQASPGSTVEYRRTREFPVFTCYRFDDVCVGVLYAQAPGRTDVPTFECEKGGTLYSFFRDQFDGLWEGSVRPPDETEAL